jgi:hypothetical protein
MSPLNVVSDERRPTAFERKAKLNFRVAQRADAQVGALYHSPKVPSRWSDPPDALVESPPLPL